MLGTYTVWPLSSDGSLTCNTYCDTGHPGHLRGSVTWHSHQNVLPSVWQWSCHYLFLRLRSVAAGIRTPNLPLAGERTSLLLLLLLLLLLYCCCCCCCIVVVFVVVVAAAVVVLLLLLCCCCGGGGVGCNAIPKWIDTCKYNSKCLKLWRGQINMQIFKVTLFLPNLKVGFDCKLFTLTSRWITSDTRIANIYHDWLHKYSKSEQNLISLI